MNFKLRSVFETTSITSSNNLYIYHLFCYRAKWDRTNCSSTYKAAIYGAKKKNLWEILTFINELDISLWKGTYTFKSNRLSASIDEKICWKLRRKNTKAKQFFFSFILGNREIEINQIVSLSEHLDIESFVKAHFLFSFIVFRLIYDSFFFSLAALLQRQTKFDYRHLRNADEC